MKKKRLSNQKRPPQSTRGSESLTSTPRRTPILGLLVVSLVAVIAVAFYGMRYLQDGGDSSEQPVSTEPIALDPIGNAAHIPTTGGSSWKEIDDPSRDGWDTEVFAGKATKQLKTLGKLLAHPRDIDAAAFEGLINDDFACGPLRPSNLVTVLDDRHLKIDRASVSAADQTSDELPVVGTDALAEMLRAAAAPFSTASDVRFKVKLFRVSPASDEVVTRQYFSISGRTKSGMVQQHATWDIGWAQGNGDALPHMRWLRVVEFEQVESRQPTGVLFADCAESVLGRNSGYADQFLRGMNHWFRRIQDRSSWEVFGNPGLAVGDVNGDGLDDLYVCQEGGLPNRLFIQNLDGTADEQSASWGVDWLQSSRSALLVDLDNDSDQDLVVAVLGGVVVAENDGEGRFRLYDVLATSGDPMSLSAVDYDLDGRLDIYVCGYFQREKSKSEYSGLGGARPGFVYHDANNGGSNSLFRNQISADAWRFTDVTAEAGLNENNSRWSLAASWDDYDNDGDQDLYVANDYGRDNFYRNDLINPSGPNTVPTEKPQFVDISESAQVEDSAGGMSITWGDYDRDGWMDVLVSNMWSSAGNRITFQDGFRPNTPDKIKRRFQRMGRGNTLLQNQGDGTFDDRSAPAGVEMGRWAWGSHFVDLNNDGWEDLVVSNGFITTEDTGDL